MCTGVSWCFVLTHVTGDQAGDERAGEDPTLAGGNEAIMPSQLGKLTYGQTRRLNGEGHGIPESHPKVETRARFME
jgi:hypothetical protein